MGPTVNETAIRDSKATTRIEGVLRFIFASVGCRNVGLPLQCPVKAGTGSAGLTWISALEVDFKLEAPQVVGAFDNRFVIDVTCGVIQLQT